MHAIDSAQYASRPKNLNAHLERHHVTYLLYDLHLDTECLKLADEGGLATSRPFFRDECGNIHTQVTDGSEKDQTVNRLSKPLGEREGTENESNADKREITGQTFSYNQSSSLALC